MINFSIVTVAKGRYETFTKVCTSIWGLASKPKEIEHIIAYDHDDDKMFNFVENYKNTYPECQIIGVPIKVEDYNHRNIHKDYWNKIAKMAQGKIIFGVCNDCVLLTQDYDKIMLDSVQNGKEKFGHSVFQILVDDDSGQIEEYPKNFFCSWIILTTEAVLAIDGLAPSELPFQGADRAVYFAFSQTIRPSQLDLRSIIKTEHISHYTGRAEVDEITQHRPLNFNRPCVLSPAQMEYYVSSINAAIQNQILS